MVVELIQRLDALDRALVANGWPALSPWWRSTFGRFVGSGRRQLVVRAGRRAGKSSSLCRLAVAHALAYDARQIPPGDLGVVAFISTTRDEAAQRLRTIKAMLDALGLGWRPIESGIELVDRPIAFRVFAATIAGVSGFTSILVIADEVSKWRDADSGANPATEVLASLRPTTATQRNARIVLSSSPLTFEDAHAKAFEAGETDYQLVAYAPTWEANPTVTEEQTRADEPDARIWSREYAAIPQAGRLAAFDVDAVDRAFAHPRADGDRGPRYLIVDPSSGRKDSFTWCVCSWVTPRAAKAYLDVELVDGLDGRFWDFADGEQIVDRLVSLASEWDCESAHGDQREAMMLSAAFAKRSLRYEVHDWTNASKVEAVERVRRWLAEGTLALPPHERLRRELLAFEERVTPSGAFTFGARGSGHDDYVALLVTAAIADVSGEIVSRSTAYRYLSGVEESRFGSARGF